MDIQYSMILESLGFQLFYRLSSPWEATDCVFFSLLHLHCSLLCTIRCDLNWCDSFYSKYVNISRKEDYYNECFTYLYVLLCHLTTFRNKLVEGQWTVCGILNLQPVYSFHWSFPAVFSTWILMKESFEIRRLGRYILIH